ncbi:hypothetical protein MGMO_8c00710 [Methyloglobulus morosus KoM1]|uniref:Uncharacterized protein n=1 Tax=Methyloglobulus morosus KoM1 TaxID=1116472 RepID=V5C1F0_9GAMM|nr:hypothetical protein MGMO_8c00710 [Methyloglobulus morosus KoM1]
MKQWKRSSTEEPEFVASISPHFVTLHAGYGL